jgi:hypothetical protein
MSTLRSAVEELDAEDLARVTDAALEQDLREIERTFAALEAQRARRLAEVERRGSWALDGHLSVTAWVRDRCRVAATDAARQVRLARALRDMPLTARALAAGDVSSSAVTLLASAREAAPERFAQAERLLVDAAASLPARELGVAAARWRELADDGAAASERRRERRRLSVSPTFEGMVRVDGDLDPECGQTLIAALRAVQDSWVRADHASERDRSTPAQRRADALGEICREWLDSPQRPTVAGERPHVVVTVDLQALRGLRGGRAELDEAGPVAAETARRLACDAGVSRVIVKGRSEPLDVGRRTPVVPAAMRRAVIHRDGGCRFPGCDRPAPWCDAHHVHHWADGGDTSLDNLVLLCRPHHRMVHEGPFGLEMLDGRPVFRRPDGDVLPERAPP